VNILIMGSGGREYSLGLYFKRDEKVEKIYFVPGNGATSNIGENIDIKDYEKLAQFAKDKHVQMTIVGPEAPLVDGVVDIFKAQGLAIFGPSKTCSQLEGSKIYMKEFLKRYNVPTAAFLQTTSIEKASAFIDKLSIPVVIKADGLCGGKGVIIAQSHEEAKDAARDMLSGESFGDAGNAIVVEEFLDGYELSVFAVCDGENYVILPAAQDHKRIGDGDTGPNTGGMGAYAPTPLIDEALYQKINERVVDPTLAGMKSEGTPYEGVLFIGIMVVNGEPIVLEYNVRFGDPECEILMPLMNTPASEFFGAAIHGNLDTLDVEIDSRSAVGVVMASRDYPYKSSAPAEIIVDKIVHEDLSKNSHISYAGVSREDGVLYASGGRVLVCVGLGDSIQQARDRAYMLCGQVHFAGKKFRTDIAYQALK